MRKKYIRKVFSVLLAVVLTAGVCVSAGASGLSGDLNGDGKVTAFDAQMLAESNTGKRQLNDSQQQAASRLTVRDIIDTVLGKILPPSVQVGDTFLSTGLAPVEKMEKRE